MGRALFLPLLFFVASCAAGVQAHPTGHDGLYRQQKSESPANAGGGAVQQQAEEAKLNAAMVKLYKEGKYDEALPLAKQILAARERTRVPADLSVASALSNLATIYIAKGRYLDAEPLIKKSLSINEKIKGREHLSLSPILDDLGLVSYAIGKNGTAENSYQRALSIRRTTLGPTHSEVLKATSRLAGLYEIREEYEKAEPLLKQLVELQEKPANPNRDALFDALYQYACLKRKMNRKGEAEQMEAKAQEIAWPQRDSTDPTPLADEVINGKAIRKPAPRYPEEAKQTRQSGKVEVQILVNESGKVMRACAISGKSALWRAAESAAYSALFSPTTLNGKPVKVRGIITYNFVLQY